MRLQQDPTCTLNLQFFGTVAYHAVRVDAGTYQLHCLNPPPLLADGAMSDHPEQGGALRYDKLHGAFAC